MVQNLDGWYVEPYKIDKVEMNEESFVLTVDGSVSSSHKNVDGYVPQVGDVAVFYLSSPYLLGSTVHGLTINGQVIKYETKQEAEMIRQKWLDDYDAKRQKAYDENLGKWQARAALLPTPYRERLRRFDEKNGVEWWKDSGEYELFTLEESAKFYNWAKQQNDPVEALTNFESLEWDEQRKTVDFDEGHSGWTFSAAVGLALRVLQDQPI